MDGWITNIQPFSLHDGPGVRTTVFFAGCNLACRWCHNPEAIPKKPRLQFFAAKCAACGRCAAACPTGAITQTPPVPRRSQCIVCGKCVAACPNDAVTLSCRRVTPESVMAEIAADKSFYHNTGGGATFSGGEPFLQPDFLAALAGLCREGGIHTAVETAGNIDYDCITPVLPLIDLVICDLKAVDERLHRGGTGVSNGLILENITRLSRNAAKLWVRVPLIPGYNDSVDELERIGNFLSGIEAEKVELMAYHRLGIAKYESLGLSAPTADLKPPETADMARARDCVQAAMKIGVVTIS